MKISMSQILKEKLALEEMLDYKFESTFYEEFCVAEKYGSKGIKDYYDLAFNQWKDNLMFLTELVMVLNLKIFLWYGVNDTIGQTYDQLWKKTDDYALDSLRGEDLHYYLSTLD